MQAVALTTGQFANPFLLVGAFEVETAHVGTGRHFKGTYLDDIQPVGYFFPHGFVAIQFIPGLIHVGNVHGLTQMHFAFVRLLLAHNHAEQGGLTGPVGADDADDGTFGNGIAEVVVQDPITK